MGRVYEDEKPSNAILKAKECGISMGGKRAMSSGFRYICVFVLYEFCGLLHRWFSAIMIIVCYHIGLNWNWWLLCNLQNSKI